MVFVAVQQSIGYFLFFESLFSNKNDKRKRIEQFKKVKVAHEIIFPVK